MYDGTTGGYIYAECLDFCMDADKEKIMADLASTSQRETIGEWNIALKSSVWKKPKTTNNQEASNLKDFS